MIKKEVKVIYGVRNGSGRSRGRQDTDPTRIEKVFLNSEKDISEEVREIEEAPIPDIDIW
ncbi:hypothetical protein [Bacillus methanolicus]|uniref:hypothetical protein n=1 Tax=Bacillus methanolicus TaxID=1471 RepID=UPI00025F235F|nr:hypothetical protein [Bacillus methanolicus]EIJ80799.1 hypothetical protein MGA3_10870 [Bacillus methanolicus MGA3]